MTTGPVGRAAVLGREMASRCSPERGPDDLINEFVGAGLRHCLGNATQMRLEDVTVNMVQRTLDRRQLMEHIDAVTVIFGHADHSVEMALRRSEPKPNRGRLGLHG